MEELILTINKLQNVNNKYKIAELQLPQIIVVGSQSSGKSSVMERIIGYDILPKAAKVATRCPIILQLINKKDSDDISAIFEGNGTKFLGLNSIYLELQKRTDQIGKTKGVISDPIILQLHGNSHPTLTLIDLPGIIKNNGELPPGSKEKISKLSEDFAMVNNSIILAISSANVDLANSDSIAISKKYDPEGTRTINVITKIDLMDEGTSVSDILKSEFFQKSLGTVCVVNRSQKHVTDKKSIFDTNNDERAYLEERSNEIPGRHGVEFLIEQLVQRLKEAIMKNVPTIEKVIFQRIQILSIELKDGNDMDKGLKIYKDITKFIEEYIKLIKGNRNVYENHIIGGAKISHVLYNDFPKSLSNCQVSQWNKTKISNRITNTLGNQEKYFSIQDPFRSLLFEEIGQFLIPSIRCNTDVKDLLNEFVVEVLKEFKLDKYSNLSTKIKEEMNKYIEKKYEYMEEIIKHVIKSEEREIKNIKPESDLFKDLQSYIEKIKSNGFGELLSSITTLVGIALPPQMKLVFTIVQSAGLLNTLKNVVSQFIQESTNVDNNEEEIQGNETKFQSSIPGELMDIFSKVSQEHFMDKESILKFLYSEKKLPTLFEEIIKQTQETSTDTNDVNSDDIKMIELMVKEHFKRIQNNVLYNVPKLIQSTFIEDLLEGLNDALYAINKEDPDYLLNITLEEAKKLQMKKDELKELKDIFEDLKKLKRPQ